MIFALQTHLANTGTADTNSDPVLLPLGPYHTYCNPSPPAVHNWHTRHYFRSLSSMTLCDVFHKGGLLAFPSSITVIQAGFLQAGQADSLQSKPPRKPKNTGMGNLSLLQGNFPTQESNWGLQHCRWILYQLSYQGS